MLRAVVFDFDGTILDTEEPEYRAWTEIYRSYGCELTVAEWSECIGTHDVFDPWATLAQRASAPVAARSEIEDIRRARNRQLVAAAEVQPGILDWLADAEALGLAVGIASSSPPDWIEGHLERLALRHRFSCIACRDGTLPAKPDPASYRAACDRLGVAPADAVAVEDSPHGVAAAVAAGLFTIAVPHGLTRHFDFSAAHVVVDSLAALPLRGLAEGWVQRGGRRHRSPTACRRRTTS